MESYWKEVNTEDTELEGPYECPSCGGHIMIDVTYLDQVETLIICPYCESKSYVREDFH